MALRHTLFEEIEQELGYSMCEVQHKHGRSDPRYITLARLQAGSGSLHEVCVWVCVCTCPMFSVYIFNPNLNVKYFRVHQFHIT